MKVRALQDCYIDGVYRRGIEYDVNDKVLGTGEVFDVPDTMVLNREVLEELDSDGNPLKPPDPPVKQTETPAPPAKMAKTK